MRITFLVMGGEATDDTETVLARAARLTGRHEVEVIAVVRPVVDHTPQFPVPVRCLIELEGSVARPLRDHAFDEPTCRALGSEPSALLPPGARFGSGLSLLSDIELRHALGHSNTDVLVGTTPELAALVTSLGPATAVTVGHDQRAGALSDGRDSALLPHTPWLDAVVVPGESARSWLAGSLGPAAPALATIPPAAPSGFRPRSGLDSATVLVAQDLVPENRTDHAIQAFAKVTEAHPGWSLRIRGDGPERSQLGSLVTELELHDRVEFLRPEHSASRAWAVASICLLPAIPGNTTAPRVLEAFAAGVPAVCYDAANGPAEVVRHGTDGLLVPAGDIEALAAALDRLMADEPLRGAYGAAALDSTERYSPDLITARWEALFSGLGTLTPDERSYARADRAARHAATTARNGMVLCDARWDQATSQVPGLEDEEQRIHHQHPHLVRSAGQLAEVRDELLPHDALQWNLDLIAEALDYFGVPYALVRGTGTRYRVMVTEERSAAALAAVATTYGSDPVYATPLRPRARLSQPVLAGMVTDLTGVSGVRVFRPVVTTGRTLRYGADHGADLEFWQWTPDGDCYVAPRGTAIGGRLPQSAMTPASLRVTDRDYPSFEPFTRRLTTDVDFPIDAVCDLGDHAVGTGDQPQDTPPGVVGGCPLDGAEWLRYALRSIAMFAPWAQRVFVITTGPVPRWLETSHPDVAVVRRPGPPGGCAPALSAPEAEHAPHAASGLGEHLLHLRKGVFIGRLVGPERFFHSNGMARFVRARTAVPLDKPDPEDPPSIAVAKRNRALVEDAFERCTAHGFAHAPAPLRRSVLAEIHERFPSESSQADGAFAPVELHHYYAYLTGRAVPGRLRHSEIDTGETEQHPELNRLLRARDRDAISLTASVTRHVPLTEQRRMARAFLRSYFPIPSPYERAEDP